MDPYQQYIFKSRYARYKPELNRREEWPETVRRYISFFETKHPDAGIPFARLEKAITNMEVMPSMRALMTAGPALDRDNVAGYNCAYVAVDNQRVFDEIMYILMCGTGVGFSVERQYINKLPEVAEEFHECDTIIKVRDSKIGWASAYRQLVSLLYNGSVPRWDTSGVRPEGSRLRTFGGRASGPAPLNDLFSFTEGLFRQAKGRKLNSIEVHDLVCKTAEVVVCGGVRRSALLSLSNLTDQRMRNAKQGEWYHANPHRALANNSVSYTERPDMGIFLEEWLSLFQSKAGERGIYNRKASQAMAPARRDSDYEFGTNPCSEIVLRSKQFCNLTEVVCRPDDSLETLKKKVENATILGTIQSTLVDFRYLSKDWFTNTSEERLLGVSLTGIMDMASPALHDNLEVLRDHAISVNKKWAKTLGIPASTAITCVKPSGTVSQLVDTASGIHSRYAPFYIRRVRADTSDPLCKVLQDAGVPNELSRQNPRELVFSFYRHGPHKTYQQPTAEQQLEIWKHYALNWCEHKPSMSVYVKEYEWLKVAAWVYENWDICNGLSFFPKDDHMYPQAPYEEITEDKYNEEVAKFPTTIDFNIKEEDDMTTASQELACVGGACDL